MTNNLDTIKPIKLEDLKKNGTYNLRFDFRNTEIWMTNLNYSGVLSEIQNLISNRTMLNSSRGQSEQVYDLKYFITSADQTKNL